VLPNTPGGVAFDTQVNSCGLMEVAIFGSAIDPIVTAVVLL
jgi:energy-converting hydrogenase Eha subunit C